MANRKMMHRGTVKATIPAVYEEEFDPSTGLTEKVLVQEEKEIEYDLPHGANKKDRGSYGPFPIGVPIDVPKKWQPILKKKGFEFVKQEELAEFESEQTANAELDQKERERAMEAVQNAPGGASGHGTDSEAGRSAKKKGGK